MATDALLMHFSKQALDDPLVLERGEGPYVFDTHGRRYIDALSSLFCSQIGYSYGEEIAAAATRQMTTLAFNTNWGTSTRSRSSSPTDSQSWCRADYGTASSPAGDLKRSKRPGKSPESTFTQSDSPSGTRR